MPGIKCPTTVLSLGPSKDIIGTFKADVMVTQIILETNPLIDYIFLKFAFE